MGICGAAGANDTPHVMLAGLDGSGNQNFKIKGKHIFSLNILKTTLSKMRQSNEQFQQQVNLPFKDQHLISRQSMLVIIVSHFGIFQVEIAFVYYGLISIELSNSQESCFLLIMRTKISSLKVSIFYNVLISLKLIFRNLA